MSYGRSIPTEDRISDLPESILCHILSFLPTKSAGTTMIISKRWKPVWLAILILNLDDKAFNNFETFRKFVYSIMFSLRDQKTSIQSFTLKLGYYSRFKQGELNRIFKFVMQQGVKNLNFDLSGKPRCIKLPPCILSCKTLQVLRLENIKMWDFDQVNFPCLKTLHLNNVDFTSPKYFAKFLYVCPILEDLNAKSRTFQKSIGPMENLNALPNLVKVKICYNTDIPMSLVCKTRILHIEQVIPPNATITPECLSSQLKTLSIQCSTDTKNINNFRLLILQESTHLANDGENWLSLDREVTESAGSRYGALLM
ncbi:putative FBD-associated F-box protein At5g22720, partial [Vicia villosa]